jgi:hypothetical protein
MKRPLLLLFISSASLYAQVDAGLTAHYSFNDGNANDEIGTNDGTVNGAVLTTDRFGNANHAYYFDGITNYIDLGSDAAIKPTTGSISIWFNIDAISTSGSGFNYNPIMLAKNDQAGSSYFEGYAIYVVNTDNKILTVTTESMTPNQKYIFSANSFMDDTWHHAVMCYDDDSLWFYTDGVLENAVLKDFVTTLDPAISVLLGKSGDAVNDRYFNGSIDDIRIYDRLLNAAEIEELFNEPDPATLHVTEVNSISISMYPNPANTELMLTSEFPQDFCILNTCGEIILHGHVNEKTILDISTLSRGIYFIQTPNGNTTKFVKL